MTQKEYAAGSKGSSLPTVGDTGSTAFAGPSENAVQTLADGPQGPGSTVNTQAPSTAAPPASTTPTTPPAQTQFGTGTFDAKGNYTQNTGQGGRAPTTAEVMANKGQFDKNVSQGGYGGTSFDPNLWVNPNGTTGYQNSNYGNNSGSGPINGQPQFNMGGDFSGAFSGGNQQYLYSMSPEDKNAVYGGTADIPSLLKKYGLSYDPASKRMYKASDWLQTNNPNVQVNQQTGGTYNTPGMGQVNNQQTFGTNPGQVNSPYNLPGGQFDANNKTGALTQAMGAGNGAASTSTAASTPATSTATTASTTPAVDTLAKNNIPEPVWNQQQQGLINALYGSTPYTQRNQLVAAMTGVDPRFVNGQINPGYVPGQQAGAVVGYGGNPQLKYNPETGGYSY